MPRGLLSLPCEVDRSPDERVETRATFASYVLLVCIISSSLELLHVTRRTLLN